LKKRRNHYWPLAGAVLALGACDGTSLESAEVLEEVPRYGTLIAESIESATVCIDQNRNYACDSAEPSVLVDDAGRYQLDEILSSGRSDVARSVIATFSDKPELALVAAPGRPELISGATTLVHHMVAETPELSVDEAWSAIATTFTLSPEPGPTIESHAPRTRLRRLATYLESYAEVSAGIPKSTPASLLDALSFPAPVRAHLDAQTTIEAPGRSPVAKTDNIAAFAGPIIGSPDKYDNLVFTQGMRIGTGWDDVRSSVMGNTQCLESFTVEGSSAFQRDFQMTRVTSKLDLAESLNISGKITLGISTFDATIEGKFYDLMELDENSVYVLARLTVRLADFNIVNAKMALDGFGDCNEPDAEGRCPDGLLNNQRGEQLGTIRELYTREDGELFRSMCGDRYINTVTTGGSYFGVLKLKASNQQEKRAIEASVDAKIGEALEVEGAFEALFDELAESENTEIIIMSRGAGSGDTVVRTPEQFDEDLDNFLANMCLVHKDICEVIPGTTIPGDEWRRSPFRVKYESYQPTTLAAQGGDASADRSAMELFVGLTNDYQSVRNEINNMLARPVDYEGVIGREAELQARINEIVTLETIVKSLHGRCNGGPGRICVNLNQPGAMAAQGLKTIVELRGPNEAREWLALPPAVTRYPRSCLQHRDIYPSLADDGNKLLYMGGDKDNKFYMYCEGMDDPDSPPSDYLTLENFDTASNNPSDNFSKFFGLPGADGEGPTEMTTVYKRLKVVVNADSLKVDVAGQENWRTTLGGPVIEPVSGQLFTDAPYATAKSCDPLTGRLANINLTGTRFKVSDRNGFEVPERQSELITEPKTWYHALRDAQIRGGRLPLVFSDEENQRLADLLNVYGYTQAWLGVRATWRTNARRFAWPDGSSEYYNFANPNIDEWINEGPQSRGDYCGIMRSSDGQWEPAPCRTEARPYFVEYRKTEGQGVELIEDGAPSTRQVFDIEVASQYGCGSLVPDSQLVLEFDPSLAPLTEPSH